MTYIVAATSIVTTTISGKQLLDSRMFESRSSLDVDNGKQRSVIFTNLRLADAAISVVSWRNPTLGAARSRLLFVYGGALLAFAGPDMNEAEPAIQSAFSTEPSFLCGIGRHCNRARDKTKESET
ncbi:MAG: hypothetical protein B7X53_16620 [Hyphomonas sp. 34-62-18]|nr:MAG: hypothetical protein B7X53_16620 [Hyphomonas sp. 34-62-18]